MHDDQRQPRRSTVSQNFNMLAGIATILSVPVTALLRKPGTCGERYFGGRALIGMIVMVCFVALGGGRHVDQVAFGAVFVLIAALVIHRAKHQQLARQGYRPHSLFRGERAIPADGEAVLVFIAGGVATAVSTGLGVYLMLAAVSLGIVEAEWNLRVEAQKRAIRDAQLENEFILEQARKEGRQ